jgi:hypothetical protein
MASAFGGIADMACIAAGSARSRLPQSGSHQGSFLLRIAFQKVSTLNGTRIRRKAPIAKPMKFSTSDFE